MSFVKLLIFSSLFHHCVAMKVAVLRFSRRDEVRKLKLFDTPDVLQVDQFSEIIRNNLPDIKIESLEYYNDDLGMFEKKEADHDIIVDRFVSILVVEGADDTIGGTDMLLIEGRAFDISSGLQINGYTLNIIEKANRSEGTGLNTWDGSVVLAKYLERHPHVVSEKSILEVGAGTGVAGMAAHLIGAELSVLTDLEYVLDNLEENIGNVIRDLEGASEKRSQGTKSPSGQLLVRPLDWGDINTYIYPVASTATAMQLGCEQAGGGSGSAGDMMVISGAAKEATNGLGTAHGQWDVILGKHK
jgi:hypothetical protein